MSLGAAISASPSFQDYPFGLASLFTKKREAASKEESAVCKTEECKLLANTIKDSIDDSVDPCDDFYQYACGKWDQKNPVPENETSWSLWDQVSNKINKQVEEIIQAPIEPDDLFAVKLAKKWFDICMKSGTQGMKELEPLVATIWRHGGWPLIMEKGEWDDRIYHWQIVDDHFARLTGRNSFHDLYYVQLPWTDDENYTLVLDTPHLPLGLYSLLSEDSEGADASDENNESGEGSQENGSKEKIPKPGNDDDDENEEDEGIEEDNEPEDEEENEASKARRVSRRKSPKRLGHGRRSSDKLNIEKQRHEARLRRRPKRDVIKEIVLHKQRGLKKRAKHAARSKSRKPGKKSTGHSHMPLPLQRKTSVKKNDSEHAKKSKNAAVKSAKKTRAMRRNRAKNNEENEKARRKYSNHRHVHEKKSIHGSHQRRQRMHGNRRVHHAAKKMEDKETDELPNDDDSEIDGNDSGNEVDTGDSGKKDDSTNDEENDDDEMGNDEENDDEEGEKKEDDENDGESGEEEKDGGEEEEEDDEDIEKTIEELKTSYRNYIIFVAEMMSKVRGLEVSRDKLEKDANDLVEFAIKMGEITYSHFELENMTLHEFQEWYDDLNTTSKTNQVNWEKKVMKLFGEAGVEPEGDMNAVIPQLDYFEGLRALLDETPAEVIVNYIHWLFVSKTAPAISPEIRELAKEWAPRSIWEKKQMCTQVEMADVIGYEYTKKHFPKELERMARDMIDDIQKEVEYQIKESTWLDENTKHFILGKLVHLQHLVGSPDWYQNSTMVQRYFQGLTIGTSYYENMLNYMRYMKLKSLRYAMSPDEYPTLTMNPLMVNAFFMPTKNLIAISAADLQNPFFAYNRPWNTNFAIIGSIIGHEVNHGFDDMGHLYDRKGNPTEWLSAMASAYNKRADCFIEQFNNYELIKGDDFKVKNYGNQTIGENIADTMGLEAVYRAYHRRLRECKKPDSALPGLEKFNNDQIFFLSFANLWCEAFDEDAIKDQAKYDVHSPGRLRVIGSVSNLEGFAKSFNCPAGSPMNPERKCNIWI